MQLDLFQSNPLRTHCDMSPAEPLWKRVPKRNADGRLLSDFMMIIPGLRQETPQAIKQVIAEIQYVLNFYQKSVVFADLNLKLNVLWVSVQPVAGICLEVAAAIHHRVPQAKLVASNVHN